MTGYRTGPERGAVKMTANRTGSTEGSSTVDVDGSTTKPLRTVRGRDTDQIRQKRGAHGTEKALNQKCDLPRRLITPGHGRRLHAAGPRQGVDQLHTYDPYRRQVRGQGRDGSRCPCLRGGREIPTALQRLIIIYRQISDRRRGRDFGTGIHLNEALEWSKRLGPPHSSLQRGDHGDSRVPRSSGAADLDPLDGGVPVACRAVSSDGW